MLHSLRMSAAATGRQRHGCMTVTKLILTVVLSCQVTPDVFDNATVRTPKVGWLLPLLLPLSFLMGLRCHLAVRTCDTPLAELVLILYRFTLHRAGTRCAVSMRRAEQACLLSTSGAAQHSTC